MRDSWGGRGLIQVLGMLEALCLKFVYFNTKKIFLMKIKNKILTPVYLIQ